MLLNATIEASDINDLFISLNEMIPVAKRTAMQAAIDAANQAIISAMATENDLPVTVISHRVMTNISSPAGKIWIGTLPVNTEYLQPFEESGSGAYAGHFFFEGAFIVDKYGLNREYLAKRYYNSRYPIRQIVTEDLRLKRTMGKGSVIEMAGDTYMQVFIDKMDEIQ